MTTRSEFDIPAGSFLYLGVTDTGLTPDTDPPYVSTDPAAFAVDPSGETCLPGAFDLTNHVGELTVHAEP